MLFRSEDKTSAGRVYVTRISKGGTQTTKILSEKEIKGIGQEGEKYALYKIIKDKLVKHFKIKIGKYNTFEEILKDHADIVKETNKGFSLEKNENVTVEVMWLNKNGESKEHHDIEIVENGEEKIFIEVKSTKEDEKDWFLVSKSQWMEMQEKGDKFWIYRVYGIATKKQRLVEIKNPAKLWKEGDIIADPIKIQL